MKLFIVLALFSYLAKSNVINDDKKKENDNLMYHPGKNIPDVNLNYLLKHVENYVEKSVKLPSLLNNFFNFPNSFNLINEIKTEWTNFKIKFKKAYVSASEEAKRFLNFLRNYIQIKSHNMKFMAGTISYNVSINHLSDLSDTEYSALLGLKLAKHPKGRMYISPLSKVDLPTHVDYRKTAVTPVKDQGNCGSCWAFSTTGSLEGQHYRKTKKLVSLSEQQLVDCSLENNGCGGGLMDKAFEYIKQNGGIDTEESYPYVSGKLGHRQDNCKYNNRTIGANDFGFVDIMSGDEEKLKEAVALIGPISVGIDASQMGFRNYRSGIYEDPDCSSEELDHGVLVVGYGVDHDSKIPYWIVKNSWNTTWGDKGYIKMKRNAQNMCGIATAASYPLV